MTRAEAVEALLDTWSGDVGDEAAHGVLLGILLGRSDPALAEIVERGVEEMVESDSDAALANQAAREQFGAAVRDWLREQGAAA